ncbi:MAG: DNA polymerase III subunit delta' [uncultured bacterium]|nr:MAG: DNA polymerase III subunit delta' [uncultured bacterium]HBY73308.1 hypothetical protein [Candidatus Kerfeldbacteria bacterium]
MRYTKALVGNQAVSHYLQKTIKNGIVPRAQLWVGPEHIGKTTFLINYLFQAWCEKQSACQRCWSCTHLKRDSHSGLRWLDGAELDMAAVRAVLREAAETNFSVTQRAIVVTAAEQLSVQVCNALLKLLEEPRGHVVLYLLASTLEGIPATVISRCSIIRFHPVSDAELLAAWPEQATLIPWCHGCPGSVHTLRLKDLERWSTILQQTPVERLASIGELKRPDALHQLEGLESVVYQQLAIHPLVSVQALRAIAQARDRLRTTAQVKLVMSNLLLNIFPTV